MAETTPGVQIETKHFPHLPIVDQGVTDTLPRNVGTLLVRDTAVQNSFGGQ
jgi:hypothetical protein